MTADQGQPKSTSSEEPKRRYGLKFRVVLLLFPLVYKVYMAIVSLTSKKTVDELIRRKLAEVDNGLKIVATVWHQDLVSAPFGFRGRPVLLMVSRSRDGELAAAVVAKCGFIPVRGSSSRGGKDALRAMADCTNARQEGTIGVLTVDGPRGPRHVCKAGAVVLAQRTGLELYAVRCWAKRQWVLDNWDGSIIPLPFNHLLFLADGPIRVPPDATADEIEASRKELERLLNHLTQRARAFFGETEPGKTASRN